MKDFFTWCLGIGAACGVFAIVIRLARGYFQGETAVGAVPAIKTQLSEQDKILAVMENTLKRLEAHVERGMDEIKADVRAVEGRMGGIERDVSILRRTNGGVRDHDHS